MKNNYIEIAFKWWISLTLMANMNWNLNWLSLFRESQWSTQMFRDSTTRITPSIVIMILWSEEEIVICPTFLMETLYRTKNSRVLREDMMRVKNTALRVLVSHKETHFCWSTIVFRGDNLDWSRQGKNQALDWRNASPIFLKWSQFKS